MKQKFKMLIILLFVILVSSNVYSKKWIPNYSGFYSSQNYQTPQNYKIKKIQPIKSNLDIMYAMSSNEYSHTIKDHVFKSIDGGKNWFSCISQESGSMDTSIDMWVEPNDGKLLFVSIPNSYCYNNNGCKGGLYRSTDAGLSWKKIVLLEKNNQKIKYPKVNKIIIDPNQYNIVYMLTTDNLYKSVNFGTDWDQIGTELNFDSVGYYTKYDFFINIYNSNNIFFLYNDKLFVSNDAGNQWSLLVSNMGTFFHYIQGEPPIIIYSGSQQYDYPKISIDGGIHFKSISSIQDFDTEKIPDILFTIPGKPNTIYSYATFNENFLIYTSTDNGETWNQFGRCPFRIYPYEDQFRPIFKVNPYNNNIIYAINNGQMVDHVLYKSIDKGNTWLPIDDALTTIEYSTKRYVSINQIVFDSEGNVFLATSNGIYKSGISNDWHHLKNSLSFSENEFHQNPQGIEIQTILQLNEQVIVGLKNKSLQDSNIYINHNNPAIDNWESSTPIGNSDYTPSNSDKLPNINSLTMIHDTIYAATSRGVYISNDNGKNWNDCNNGLVSPNDIPFNVSSIIIDKSNSQLLYVGVIRSESESYSIDDITGGGVYKSVDGGYSWMLSSYGINEHGKSRSSIYALLINSNNSTILAGSEDGIYKSIDSGSNWTLFSNDFNLMEGEKIVFNELAFSPENERILYAATNKGLFYSIDGGIKWNIHPFIAHFINYNTNSIPIISINTILLDKYNEDNIYLGTDRGVFASFDKGYSWVLMNDGLRKYDSHYPIVVNELQYSHDKKVIFAGTQKGFYYMDLGVSENEDINLDGQFDIVDILFVLKNYNHKYKTNLTIDSSNIFGDIDSDNDFTLKDVMLIISSYNFEFNTNYELNDSVYANLDCNNDDRFSIADIICSLQKLLLIDK